jgi:hypothetical protein
MQQGRHAYLAVTVAAFALLGWSGRRVLADAPPPDPAVAVTATNLPPGWAASPIGVVPNTIDEKQSVNVDSNGVWTMSIGGQDLWNKDDGGLVVYQKHTGNGSVSFRLLSQMGGQDVTGVDAGWLKTAPGFRESLDSESKDVHVSATSANNLEPAVRVNPGDAHPLHPGDDGSQGIGNDGLGDDTHPPAGRLVGNGIWVGVDRNGDNFGYYWSNDGKVWTKVAGVNFHMAADLLAVVEGCAGKDDPTDPTVPPQISKLDKVTVSNDLLAPKTISNIGTIGMDKSVLVTWNSVALPAGDVTYNVYQVDPTMVSSIKKLTATPIKETSFLAQGLTNGTPYLFAISAVADGVESGLQYPEPSQGKGGRNLPTVVPDPPVLGILSLINIGTATPGSVTVTGDGAAAKIDMQAGGWDINEAGDGFSFLAMSQAGDQDVSVRCVSGPTTNANGGGMELAGLMFRESLDAGSRFAMAQVSSTGPLTFKRRKNPYATPVTTDVSRTDNTKRPITLRLVRKGDQFSAFYSEDNGTTWQKLGDPDTIPGFAKTPYIGLALSAHSEGDTSEAIIDNIVVKPVGAL